ncbi:MAG TPA: YdaS family helix-turn-helix protein [Thiomonas arsenitoxydans]|nr:YdaS family helix-turn-helix protein [Thiomonas sp. UBA7699]HML81066.1 YdaS family helix-turn-helix protein [Thiomonas arsenitoxydans]
MRVELARSVGSTVGHLTNVAYRYRPCAPTLCVKIEAETEAAVKRWDLRPGDWHLIWPELVGTEGAPSITQSAPGAVQPQEDGHE